MRERSTLSPIFKTGRLHRQESVKLTVINEMKNRTIYFHYIL